MRGGGRGWSVSKSVIGGSFYDTKTNRRAGEWTTCPFNCRTLTQWNSIQYKYMYIAICEKWIESYFQTPLMNCYDNKRICLWFKRRHIPAEMSAIWYLMVSKTVSVVSYTDLSLTGKLQKIKPWLPYSH